MNRLIMFLFCIGVFGMVNAQDKQNEGYVQYSGKIVQFATGEPIQGVRVTNLNKGTMTLTNKKGIFTIVVSRQDKIQFSHLGMEHQYSIIPKDADTKVYEEKALNIEPQLIDEVVVGMLPSLDDLADRLMAMDIPKDPSRELALRNPDMFNILDTIIAHEPSLIGFKNGKVESSPISWFYENVYKKIKERVPKPKRKEVLPEFKEIPEKSN